MLSDNIGVMCGIEYRKHQPQALKFVLQDVDKDGNIIEDNNRLYVYYNRELITMHDISEKKINYQKEHYIEGLQSVLNGIEQEKIEKQAQKALALLENL